MPKSTPNFDLPIRRMTFNEKEEWWECPLLGADDKPVIVWLESSYEEKRIYFNVYMQDSDGSKKNIARLVSAVLFPLNNNSLSTRMDLECGRLFFDLEGQVHSEEQFEAMLTFPVLLYVMNAPRLGAWTIPYRPKIKEKEYLSEGERIAREKEMQESYAEWCMQQELQQKQIQEKIEQEWEEWEKRQEENNE